MRCYPLLTSACCLDFSKRDCSQLCVVPLTCYYRFELPKLSALLKKCAANDQTPSAEGDKLIPHMEELLEYGRYGDVVFFFPRKSQKLRAHRAVLGARYVVISSLHVGLIPCPSCEYFRTMFLSGMKEAESAEIT